MSVTRQRRIAADGFDPEELARRVAARPRLLPAVLDGLGAGEARVRYGCLKVLRLLSERRPSVLYPAFDRIAGLMDSPRNILRWGGILIVGNLAAVDRDGRTDALLERYLRPIRGPELVPAANAIAGAAKMALARPHLADRILAALLRVERTDYETPECRNVALAQVLKALGRMPAGVRNRRSVVAFARRQLDNPRGSVRSGARKLLRRQGVMP